MYTCGGFVCGVFFYSSNTNLPRKVEGNKFVWNLVVQQYLVTSLKVHKHFLFTETMVTHDLGKSSYAVACPLSCLFTLALDFFISCKLRPRVLCSTDFVIVRALLGTRGLLTFLARGGFSCWHTLSVCKQWPFRTWKVTQGFVFGVTSVLNVLSEPFVLLSWCFEAVCVIIFSLAFILWTSPNQNSLFGCFCRCDSLTTKEKQNG